ncbi:Mitogen-activated protein kinase kinase kinase [Trema orientale]|uniref:Mitogen-activated protein kinase kinase kinase n=1 Tax=Trema orientale TaxID=63057 RepID=A0A2P5E977_TREOI|nr:Mitogen-activated protein kinase kinase kinase [Trema orientale]
MIPIPSYFPLIYLVLTLGISGENQLDIALDCGFQGNQVAGNNRYWTGDINSELFPLELGRNNESITSEAVVQKLTGTDPVPYGTARLSISEFTYTIPVNPGPKFVRLHFYSAEYENFTYSISNAFFSVKAGQYTLLSNFNVSDTAKALNREDIVKEYRVMVAKPSLKITFTPSSSISEGFALVNGIEVVSMPVHLYYPEAINFLRQDIFYSISNTTALETMYRVNIGGRDITADEDTGIFFRKWEGLASEQLCLTVPGRSVLPVLLDSTNLRFTAIPDYMAPETVYQVARSMGNDRELIKKYNLTWEFPVDSGFCYMVRLHFCEISQEINSTGDRVFSIYIANQTAENRADVIRWSGGNYVPYYKDYAVAMFDKEKKKLNLSIALQAHLDDSTSKYADAILNGVEIFKLNDPSGNLAVPNFVEFQQHSWKPENNRATIIGIASGVVCGVVLLICLIGFFILRQGRKAKDSAKFSKTQAVSMSSSFCRYFSLTEIKAATNNFEDISIIGVGGFGNVYKGHIDGGTTAVAIKRLKPESSQGAHEFKTEIEMLSHLRHRNLVSLIGYCNENREMILVYEYMTRETLSNHLYNTDNPPLPWEQRLEICIGAASGLHYLHAGVKDVIIHRDVKTTNILLDEKWVAKVSDFGLSKLRRADLSSTHVSTMVKGSIGYLDPEYYRLQQLTEKSDVYSFGVVLCEVLCGRPPIMRTVERRQISLAEWARSCHQEGTLDQIVDPYLMGKIAPECLNKYGEIAVSCMLDNGAERPSMKEVVWGLECALQLQKKADEDIRLGGETAESNRDGAMGVGCSWEDPSGSIFSDINEIQAR